MSGLPSPSPSASPEDPGGGPVHPEGSAWSEHAHRALRRHGHRVGAARERVILAVAATGRATAKQLAGQLSTGTDRIAVSSVYRSLAALVDARALRTVELGGVVHYELVGLTDGGGRYLVCRCCGATASFTSPAADAALANEAEAAGYDVQHEDVIAYGRCSGCTPEPPTAAPEPSDTAAEPPHAPLASDALPGGAVAVDDGALA